MNRCGHVDTKVRVLISTIYFLWKDPTRSRLEYTYDPHARKGALEKRKKKKKKKKENS